MPLEKEMLVFLIGFLLMFAFSVVFFIRREQGKYFSTAFLVASITALAYAVLMEGSFVGVSGFAEPVYYTRWLFYIGSCSLLMLTITKVLKIDRTSALPILVLNAAVMLAGAFAAVSASPYKWLIFILGGVFFVVQLMILFQAATEKKYLPMIKIYIFAGWAIFPIVFILAPEGLSIISNTWAAILYLGLDLFTKIVFYLQLGCRTCKK